VTGVLAFDSKGPLEINASSVIIATGGFQGNPDLIARYITPTSDLLYLRSNPWSTGDGLLAASAAGAAITPLLNAFYGHAMSAPPARFNRLEFQAMSHKYGQMAVALNMAGERFADEYSGTGEELLTKSDLRAVGAHPFSDSTRRRKIKKREYPPPLMLSPQMSLWRCSSIREWLKDPENYSEKTLNKGLLK
jgi:succinate dehydrogenase/fumarate reductase flavoprotein subunit